MKYFKALLLIIGFLLLTGIAYAQKDSINTPAIYKIDSSGAYYDGSKDRFYKGGYEYTPIHKKRAFHYRPKGYFFEAQIELGLFKY